MESNNIKIQFIFVFSYYFYEFLTLGSTKNIVNVYWKWMYFAIQTKSMSHRNSLGPLSVK